ncbi:MAG: B12-binding domain-containing radical SAM protein, partial [Candidatus Hydrothermarchaeales archaeon]
MDSILYVWMPTEKIYPGGPIYLADYVHKKTDTEQKILDLSLIKKKARMERLNQEIDAFDPDIIAFSWRNIQLFSPKQDDPSLENAFKFLYSLNPIDKMTAALFGVKSILQSLTNTQETLGYINKTADNYDKKIIVGGAAFSVFSDQIITKLREGIIGMAGEGENAVLKIIEGKDKEELLDERVIFRKGKKVVKGQQRDYVKIEDFTPVDFDYINEVFPQFKEYESDYIGIQTKRGCPYGCIFCSYPFIEGKKLRFKKPDILAEEVLTLHDNFGIKKFWFTDSNFISAKKTIPHCNEFLGRIIKGGAEIEW